MALVWIFEKISNFEESLVKKLLPHFTVRAFEALEGAELQYLEASRPSHVLVHLDSLGLSLAECERHLQLFSGKKLALSKAFSLQPAAALPPQSSAFVRWSTDLSQSALCDFLHDFSPEEPLPRPSAQVLRYKDLELNLESYELRFLSSNRVESLPLKEARILKYFMQQPSLCSSRCDLQRTVWDGRKISSRTIDSHVSRLRTKLRDSQAELTNKYGEGYIFS